MAKKEILFALSAAIFLALLISPFASKWPDGLERVARDKGFSKKAEVKPALVSPIPDYAWPGFKSEKLAASFAGAAGTLFVFFAGYAVAALLKKHKP